VFCCQATHIWFELASCSNIFNGHKHFSLKSKCRNHFFCMLVLQILLQIFLILCVCWALCQPEPDLRGAHGARAPGFPPEGGLPRKTEKILKFLLRLTFAAKARKAKEKIMEDEKSSGEGKKFSMTFFTFFLLIDFSGPQASHYLNPALVSTDLYCWNFAL
jgi:hypothetical protein